MQSETAVSPNVALTRLEKTKQVKFDAIEVAALLGLDKHTVLRHIRVGKIGASLDTTKSGKVGKVVKRSTLRAYIKSLAG